MRSPNADTCSICSAFIFGFLIFLSTATGAQERYTFEDLLEDSRLLIQQPAGFIEQSPAVNPVLSYEHALQHGKKKLAVRYAIRPISMVQIDYSDPHNAAPEPNHLFPMLFQSLISHFSRGGSSPSNEYSAADAKAKFNADWAAIAAVDITPEFSPEYDQALILALHKDYAADAYIIILYDDYQTVKAEIHRALNSLKFK